MVLCTPLQSLRPLPTISSLPMVSADQTTPAISGWGCLSSSQPLCSILMYSVPSQFTFNLSSLAPFTEDQGLSCSWVSFPVRPCLCAAPINEAWLVFYAWAFWPEVWGGSRDLGTHSMCLLKNSVWRLMKGESFWRNSLCSAIKQMMLVYQTPWVILERELCVMQCWQHSGYGYHFQGSWSRIVTAWDGK